MIAAYAGLYGEAIGGPERSLAADDFFRVAAIGL